MKTLGLIGGLSWHSTTVYYKIINELVNQRLGSSYSSKLLLFSINMEEFRLLVSNEDWPGVENMMSGIAMSLENAGAGCIAICSNTPHIAADAVRKKIKIPLLHIAEETGREIAGRNVRKVGLLGTKFTMEKSFFKDRLLQVGVESIIPGSDDRAYIHAAILNELTGGIFKEETKNRFLSIIDKLKEQGAQGVVLGCTEFSLLINPSDCSLPVFDTTLIHAKALVDFALTAETAAVSHP